MKILTMAMLSALVLTASSQPCGLSDPLQFASMLGERRGCCSHHGGVCSCQGGRVICCDGRPSPTCGC